MIYNDTCEKFDSYGLPLQYYEDRDIEHWIGRHSKTLQTNRKSVQAYNSSTCGHYALKYVVHKSMGKTLNVFLNQFVDIDYYAKDRRMARRLEKEMLKKVIKIV